MKTVLILGAGASVAQARSIRPVQDGQYPPLDRDFFVRSSRMEDRFASIRKANLAFGSALRRDGTFENPWEAKVPVSLEQLFADVYYEASRSGGTASFSVYLALLRLYRAMIGETTNWIIDNRKRGCLTQLLRHEISIAEGERPTVVTFNQDLLIEDAVSRLPRRPIDGWCLRSLYGELEFSPLYTHDRAAAKYLHHVDGCKHNPPITLLKLHGSLNWLFRTTTADPEPRVLFPRSTERTIFVDNITHVEVDDVLLQSSAKRGRRNWYLFPMVVPPIYDKQRVVNIKSIDALWTKASDAIGDADRLLVFGYSLPDADVLARQLLRRSFGRNSALRGLDVIDPDVGVALKLKASLDCDFVRIYRDVPTYLAQQP